MPSTVLLNPDNSPLRTLTLSRLQLDQDAPVCTVETQGEEFLLYSLIGTVDVCEAVDDGEMQGWGTLGTRRTVTEPGPAVLWFPAGPERLLQVELVDFSADLLLASTPVLAPSGPMRPQRPQIWSHQVGAGTHQREVREVMTPAGCSLSCGETMNIPGGVSSWPPHANAEDLAKFQAGVTTWEEAFWIAAPSPGLAVLDGYYADRTPVHQVIRLENGHAYCMPLGSHMAYAAPDSYLYYAWFYRGNALQKQYRKYADDVGVYRK